MNSEPIRSALTALERELERARGAKHQIEAEAINQRGGGYEDPIAALSSILNDLHETLLVVLEAADLHRTRDHLFERWQIMRDGDGIGAGHYDHMFDFFECPSFEFVSKLIEGLRLACGDPMASRDSYELAKLETLLRKTPTLLNWRGVEPTGEMQVQEIMHDYLRAFFTDYKRSVTIAGIVKDFKPDCGIRDLKAAIEFKFADSRDEVAKGLGGIFEDASGYIGSLDWTRFYSVIYQTSAFESEDRIRSELTRAGLVTWTGILLTGAGARRGTFQHKNSADAKSRPTD